MTAKTTVSGPTGAYKATMQAVINQRPPVQLQPIRISKLSIVGYLVLTGCWLLPLMVQAQGHGQPEWWRAIENNDSDYIIGYGSGATHQEAHSEAVKEISGQLKTTVKTKDECKEVHRTGKRKAEEYTKACISGQEISTDQELSDLEPIKEEAVTVRVPVINQNKRRRPRRNESLTTKKTTHYIALGYDKTDLIGKVARVIKSATDPQRYCVSSKSLVAFDTQLQSRLKVKNVDVKNDCVIKWSLARNKRKKTNADIQWMLKALGLSLPITLEELRQLFWPSDISSKWLNLTIPSPLFYEQWFTIDIAANPAMQLPTSNPDRHLSLLYVDQAGRVVIDQNLNNKLMESRVWKEQIELYALPTPGQIKDYNHELIVAVLCTAEAQWPQSFPVIGKEPATSGYQFNELIAAIKGRRQEGSCHVAAKPYTTQVNK